MTPIYINSFEELQTQAQQFLFKHSNSSSKLKMENFGARFLVLVALITLLSVTKIMAQDLAVAPTSGLETGAGFALSFSKALICSSILGSLFALLKR